MLHIAVVGKYVEVVRLLINNGADVDHFLNKKNGSTALTYAAERGDIEMVRLMINNEADVHHVLKKNGSTALTFAADKGHVEVVRLLIDKGANVNQATKDGSTPLSYAAEQGHREIVKLLLANDADPEKKWKMLSIGRRNPMRPYLRLGLSFAAFY